MTPPPAATLQRSARIPHLETLSVEAQADMEQARRLGTPDPDVYRISDHHPARPHMGLHSRAES
ncbi:hypothetical protein E4P41_11245 [Geodermatophilus sp. DF01-2]|uniref:hypothetical protein n=1 Tax=Geodermatophilus sp. DF01-2 TaxID=2559610 RepID=UPI001073C7FC|nr:hypothetical protein [Geodermatophilus sp. DF01_2]TFV59825.1 hypothetical protein E4P41_11245 [Geodermatophilus sp. DF01_2]